MFNFLYSPMYLFAAATARSLQLCPTLCDPIDSSPPGSAVLGILQARTLECVAISFSNAWKWKVKVKSLSRVWLIATSWTAAYQAPPLMGFSRQEYWSGLPLPSQDASKWPPKWDIKDTFEIHVIHTFCALKNFYFIFDWRIILLTFTSIHDY